MTIYAPSIILSGLLGWSIDLTCIGAGLVVIGYTAVGGNRAVSQTQQQQMFIILLGMLIAGVAMVMGLPEDISYGEAVFLAGSMGRLNAITTEIDLADRYNLFSGLIGGTFLALSYFGTDQSQVQRYLGGRSITESRTGLMFNAMLKVPMQFGILFIGALMYVFYQFSPQPLIFNEAEAAKLRGGRQAEAFAQLESQHQQIAAEKSQLYRQLLEVRADEAAASPLRGELLSQDSLQRELKREALRMMKASDPKADTNDLDRVFLNFVLNHLPPGLVGLLIAVILAASMSSSSAELSALAATTVVDIYRRNLAPGRSDAHYVAASRWMTLAWGLLAIGFALFARSLGNLIQAVNIIGSLFYGTILGVFAVAFFFRRVRGSAVFWAAALTELLVASSFYLPERFPEHFAWLSIGYLWLNLAGCAMVILLGNTFQALLFRPR
jgi:Na+/proline symporter